MVTKTTMTPAALPIVSTPRVAMFEWQMTNAADAVNGGVTTPVTALFGIDTAAARYGTARYGTSGFAASAVVADKHSRQAKPAAPPRGPR